MGLIHCQSKVFFMFSFRNVNVAAQGHYCVSVRKRHHSVGLRVEAMKCFESYRCLCIYELLFGLSCDTVVAFFLLYDIFIWEKYKVQSREICSLIFVFQEEMRFILVCLTGRLFRKKMPFNLALLNIAVHPCDPNQRL